MSVQPPSSIEHEFARQYDQEHARVCLEARPEKLTRRLAAWRTEQLARQALKAAGEPGLVLDLPCGAGRFWPVLAEHGNRVILAADHSQTMLDHAQTHHSRQILSRVKPFKSSAFSIGLSENSVDCIFCMQLFQHIAASEHRLVMLREFHRVSRDTVIITVRVDGNLRTWKARRKGVLNTCGPLDLARRTPFAAQKSQIESEFRQAGFEVLKQWALVPGCTIRRVYVLRKRTD